MRTLTVAKRLIHQILGDKRAIALMFIAPIFVLFLLNIILTSSTSKPNIDLVSAPSQLVSMLDKEATVNTVNNEEEAIDNLKNKKSDAYIKFSNNTASIVVEGSDPSIRKLVLNTINKVLSDNKAILEGSAAKTTNIKQPIIQKPEISYLYGPKTMELFDSIAPLLMGFFIFFFVFLIAGVSFLRERISGTLDRILATPLKRSEIVWGYFLGFGAFVALQTIVIQTFMVYGLKVANEGSFWAVLIINLILAAGSLSLGTLLSAFARNEFQLFQFIPVIIVPQILFSGIFDLREAPQWVNILSKVFPLTYGAEALREVMIRGKGLSEVVVPTLILVGYALLFIYLNILALKKYRKV